MTKSKLITTISVALCILANACSPGQSGKKKSDKPNVIIFLVDDLGWKDVAYNGSQYYETPNIDKMAKEGMVFTNAYANAANCAPTRASLMSGLYATRHGVYTVGNPARGKSKERRLIPTPNKTILDGSFTTLAEAMKINGYKTIHLGKWHLGDDEKTGAEAQGFDINIGGNHTGAPKGGYFSPYNNPQLPDGPKGEYLTDRLTDEALKFIDYNGEEPFFMYFSHYAVHTPIQAKGEIVNKYLDKAGTNGQNDPKYAAMVESTDQSLGRLLQKLKDKKIDGNTVVILTSDNGGYGGVTTHYPLRGSKGMMYEGGFRVPMLAWSPGMIKSGTRCDIPVMSIDLYPTSVELAGEKVDKYNLDGESLLPLLKQSGNIDREAIYWHFPAYLQSYKNIKNPEDLTRGWRSVPSGAIRKGDWKLIEDFEDGSLQLYNLKEDISESRNLAESNPAKLKELHEDLKKWRKELSAPVPTQLNPDYVGQLND
ncbi:MAG: sulfatase [Carboxylicivirga sp.]|jgi:arylsulfatase A-like enzyme|nr:sulfatase [Carboxylicivirga sp.]